MAAIVGCLACRLKLQYNMNGDVPNDTSQTRHLFLQGRSLFILVQLRQLPNHTRRKVDMNKRRFGRAEEEAFGRRGGHIPSPTMGGKQDLNPAVGVL